MPKLKSERSDHSSLDRPGSSASSNRTLTPKNQMEEDNSNLIVNSGEDESSKLLVETAKVNNSGNNGVKLIPAGNSNNGHMNGTNKRNSGGSSMDLPRSRPMMSNGNPMENNSSVIGPDLNKMSNPREYQRINRIGNGRKVGIRKRKYCGSYKVIAFICGLFACILLIMGLASSEWLISSGYRQGLFVYCVGKTVNGTLPSTVPFISAKDQGTDRAEEGCHRIDLNLQLYTLIAAAFCVVSLLVNVFATLLTVLGLRCRDPNHKYKYYRIAVYVMAVALVAVLVALVVYPICFAKIMPDSKRQYWEFGWAYGVGWGASIFLFGGVILLLCDKESEEIYYKERTIVQYADSNKV